jgi:hypothetical protein
MKAYRRLNMYLHNSLHQHCMKKSSHLHAPTPLPLRIQFPFPLSTHWIEDWMYPSVGVDLKKKSKMFSPIWNQTLVVQVVV